MSAMTSMSLIDRRRRRGPVCILRCFSLRARRLTIHVPLEFPAAAWDV